MGDASKDGDGPRTTPAGNGKHIVCGVDEAGRGPLMGPLVVAGIAVEKPEWLADIGVKDSKKLTPRRREELAGKIRQFCKIEVVQIPAARIDAMRLEMTMNELEVRAFATVIERLRPLEAYLDAADTREDFFGSEVSKLVPFPVRIFSEHKADSKYPVVSGASIIAKTVRDAEMRKISEELGENAGSGYPSDPVTMSFVRRWMARTGNPPPHTRQSWETVANLREEKRIKKLESFP
jgi:ribonuclease HII